MRRIVIASAVVAAAAAAGLADARQDDPNVSTLETQVKELQKEVADLRRQYGDNSLTEARADEIRDLVLDVLADADTRASLLQGAGGVEYDGGFKFTSADGDFSLKYRIQVQVRWILNNQDGGGGDSTRYGFENRRTKLSLSGHVADNWKYKVTGAYGRSDGVFDLSSGYISRKVGNGVTWTIGQFKLPFAREELMSSKRQLVIERSLVNEALSQDRSQGIEVAQAGDTMAWFVAISDGFDTKNTSALSSDSSIAEYAITGRIEFLVHGDSFKPFNDFTSKPGSDTAVMLGAAAHYQVDDYGTMHDEMKRFTWTADVSAEGDGWNAFGAVIGNHVSYDGMMPDLDMYGVVLQGGVYVNDDTEAFLRYEWGDDDSSADDLSILTAGVNRYINSRVKASVDVGYALDEVSGTWSTSGAGWRTDAPGDDGQLVLRTQLQLLF